MIFGVIECVFVYLDGRKRWIWAARSIGRRCWVWSSICPSVCRCCSIDASRRVMMIERTKIFMYVSRSSLQEVCTYVIYSAHLRLPLHQLDGHQGNRRKRISISHASTECKSSEGEWLRIHSEKNERVSKLLLVLIDDGEVRSNQPSQPPALRNSSQTKMALLRLSDLHA